MRLTRKDGLLFLWGLISVSTFWILSHWIEREKTEIMMMINPFHAIGLSFSLPLSLSTSLSLPLSLFLSFFL